MGTCTERLFIPDADVVLHRRVFSYAAQTQLFQSLLENVLWKQHVITVYGRTINAPRLSAWYGDPGAVYRYSGLRLAPIPWTSTLLDIKPIVENLAATRFNSALVNLYRDGRDSVGWHSDAEPELGHHPVIASVSLGAERRFTLQHKRTRRQISVDLEPGSILLMSGPTQHHWRHQLPKSRQAVAARINITFRLIRSLAPPHALQTV